MDEEKITIIAEQMVGIKQFEWSKIKQIVDMSFSSKAAKVELDDLDELKRKIVVEFNLRRSV